VILRGVVHGGKKTDLKIGKGEKILNLSGYFAFKCFVDTHLHLIPLGIKLMTPDLEKEDLSDLLKKSRGKLIARGWEEMPPIPLLNSVDYPVALIRKCGHKAVVNDAAKKMLGFKENIIYEEDVDRIYDLFTFEDYEKALKIAEEELFRVGISYVHSDDLHGLSYNDMVKILKKSRIRVYEKLHVKKPKEEMFGQITDRVTIGAIKLFADGSIGARTAFMKNPYIGTGERGIFLLDLKELEDIFEFAKKSKVEVVIHVIGDAALEILSDFFSRYPGNRIIHAQFVPEEVLPKLKSTRFSVQPHFYFEDQEILKFVQTDSLKYPFLKLHRMGFDVMFSSDAPVSPHDPRYAIESALKMGFTKEEAFDLYTKGSKDICVYEKEDFLNSYPVLVVMEDGEVIEVGRDSGSGAPSR
jgi:predicted amidohydrolase YtcJ